MLPLPGREILCAGTKMEVGVGVGVDVDQGTGELFHSEQTNDRPDRKIIFAKIIHLHFCYCYYFMNNYKAHLK